MKTRMASSTSVGNIWEPFPVWKGSSPKAATRPRRVAEALVKKSSGRPLVSVASISQSIRSLWESLTRSARVACYRFEPNQGLHQISRITVEAQTLARCPVLSGEATSNSESYLLDPSFPEGVCACWRPPIAAVARSTLSDSLEAAGAPTASGASLQERFDCKLVARLSLQGFLQSGISVFWAAAHCWRSPRPRAE